MQKQQIEKMVSDAIGAVLGSDAAHSAQRQDEQVRQVAEAILDLLRPEKREAA